MIRKSSLYRSFTKRAIRDDRVSLIGKFQIGHERYQRACRVWFWKALREHGIWVRSTGSVEQPSQESSNRGAWRGRARRGWSACRWRADMWLPHAGPRPAPIGPRQDHSPRQPCPAPPRPIRRHPMATAILLYTWTVLPLYCFWTSWIPGFRNSGGISATRFWISRSWGNDSNPQVRNDVVVISSSGYEKCDASKFNFVTKYYQESTNIAVSY